MPKAHPLSGIRRRRPKAKWYFSREFKREIGVTPSQYRTQID
ncbi:MAG: AraC family transcriptional regulator [Clostridia bacterium]|nr:AraC family transcriptional regulator [Clostridia bacterium]